MDETDQDGLSPPPAVEPMSSSASSGSSGKSRDKPRKGRASASKDRSGVGRPPWRSISRRREPSSPSSSSPSEASTKGPERASGPCCCCCCNCCPCKQPISVQFGDRVSMGQRRSPSPGVRSVKDSDIAARVRNDVAVRLPPQRRSSALDWYQDTMMSVDQEDWQTGRGRLLEWTKFLAVRFAEYTAVVGATLLIIHMAKHAAKLRK